MNRKDSVMHRSAFRQAQDEGEGRVRCEMGGMSGLSCFSMTVHDAQTSCEDGHV